jgi:hypothetical protein
MTPTYHTDDYRTYPAEWVRRDRCTEVLMQLCETLEAGRWEGFYSLKAARRNGQPITIREALRS